MQRYKLTTQHAASSYGQPVLVDSRTGQAYGVADILPDGRSAIGVYQQLLGLPESAGLIEVLNAAQLARDRQG